MYFNLNGGDGKYKKDDQLKWHKLPLMEKQDEGSPIRGKDAHAGVQSSKT